MSQLKYIQNYVVNGQTVKDKLEQKYKGYKTHWLIKDREIMFWNDIEPIDGGKHYYAMSLYKWRIESDKIVAINMSAMNITPDLVMMKIVR